MVYNNNQSISPDKIISHYTYQGDFYQVKDWTFDYAGNKTNSKGYNDCLCFVLVRSGQFTFDLCNKSYEMHTGRLVIDKPNYEYSLHPAPGQCSIFNFTDDFYAAITEEYNLGKVSFFSNKNILARMLSSTAAIDYLHYQVLQSIHESGRLEIDTLVLELLKQIIEEITNKPLDILPSSTGKTNHLTAIERAKAYMNEHFPEDISLLRLSRYCYVSPFYLSRLFKSFTGLPPHKYLQEVRFKHAAMLIKHSDMPIMDICFSSGFSNTDYFSAAFTKKFKVPPSRYKSLSR
ncbi:AraC-like DNA-binding protein [Chitinophaga niastensis]|uniref:AraC-like DNA-binding protein n=1 Tax=Chitinophaga niastensis TaxID=536980 RepID=A0A2P8HGN8_CHINA|nr:helix-turn-helix domain-containing protein [Chitinophaga niastensis]PSL45381.1 AraC-like DNA-binding protein [Chitinophaga niastensis]